MKKKILQTKKFIQKDFSENKLFYFFLTLLLLTALILRTYRIDQVLSFNFDQGRDAIAINKILHGDLVLIGPTTGIEGIFRGPFYYYFLTPGYFIGKGDPAIASIYQTIFVILGYFILAILLRNNFSKVVSLTTIFLLTFSFYQIKDDRWLSNPTPAIFFSILTLLFLQLSFKKPWVFLPLAFLNLGIILQLETSGTFFIIFFTLILVIIYRKIFLLRNILISLLTFFATFIPQIIFDLRNNFLLFNNFKTFIMGGYEFNPGPAFGFPTEYIFNNRIDFYIENFFKKVFINNPTQIRIIFLLFLILSIYLIYKNWKKDLIKVLTFWFFGILVVLIFYQGNRGIVYEYYLTSLAPIFFIFVALILEKLFNNRYTLPLFIIILMFFIKTQYTLTYSYLNDRLTGGESISLGNQVQAVEYVLADSPEIFNYDVYVPPTIPYAYDYLFLYIGNKLNKHQTNEKVLDIYTIREVDLEKPERLDKWLKRQEGIATIEGQIKFGGITVEKRRRVKYE